MKCPGRSHCVPAAICLAFAAWLCAPLSARADDALATRVDALLAPLEAAHQFSGAVVLVRDGVVVARRSVGVANRTVGTALTPATPVDGGSLAKTFTAAGIWWLAQEGRLDVDAPVTRYLPEFPHARTTVRQLIAHSNGLPPYYEFFDPDFGKDEVRTTEGLLKVVARRAPMPRFEPGTRFEYSNVGYDTLALVIERVSGQGYEAFVRERFFRPNAMTASFARPARFADWPVVRTIGYRWRNGTWRLYDAYDLEAFLGASNLIFTGDDLARWAAAHAAGRAVPAAVEAIGQQRIPIAGRPSPITGLSWYCDAPGTRCYYTGVNNAFYSFVYWDRARNEAVALVSNSATPPWQMVTLQRSLVDALAGRPVAVPAPLQFEQFDPKRLATLAGSYRVEGLGTVTLRPGNEGLLLRVDDGLEFDMFPVSREVMYVPGPDFFVAFSGGARPARLHIRSMFIDASGARVAPAAVAPAR